MNMAIRNYIAVLAILVAMSAATRTAAQTATDPKIEYYLAKKDWASLVKIGQPAIPSLLAVLSDKDASVRRDAIRTLGQIGGDSAIKPIVAAMKDEKEREIRQQAAKTLIKLGYAPESIEDQVTLHVAVGNESMDKLVKIGPQAVVPLCELLRKIKADKLYSDAVFVVKALVRIGTPDKPKTAERVSKNSSGKSATPELSEPQALTYSPEIASIVVDSLIAVADGKDYVGSGYSNVASSRPLTCEAVSALGRIRDPKAVQPLIKLLTVERHNDVVKSCALAFRELGDPRASEPLAASLLGYSRSQYDTDYRRAVCDTLVSLGAVSVDPLIKALSDRSNGGYSDLLRTCALAAEALGEIGDKRAFQPLCSLLKDEDPKVRWKVVVALGELNDKRGIDPLIGALKDFDSLVREDAAKALDKLGWKP